MAYVTTSTAFSEVDETNFEDPNLGSDLFNIFQKTDSYIVLRSNITPEIAFNIADLLKPGTPSQAAAEKAVSSENPLLMKLVKPRITIRGLGMSKSIAPYGDPSKSAWILALAAFVLLGLGTVKFMLSFCRHIKPPTSS